MLIYNRLDVVSFHNPPVLGRILRKGNALDLHVDVLGQRLDGDARTGRLLSEPLLVLGVHVGEQRHVG